jgi:tRNA pseudouridine13 synthase
LRLGDHFGNRFDVRLRGLAEPVGEAEGAYRATLEALRGAGGIPNFYGPQRFGEVRPITHEVGRAIVQGDFAAAVEIYLAAVPMGDERPVDPARIAYGQDHDAAKALRDFPREYRFERSLLEHLARGHTPERALRALSRELRLLFVHAYQSLLFNRWLSERHRRGLALTEVIAGDWVLRRGRDGTVRGEDAVPVEVDNLPECSALVARGQALVGGPLIGFDLRTPVGEAGEILACVLSEEKLDPHAFQLPATPELASRGSWRPALVPLPPIDLTAESGPDDPSPSARFRFTLPRGAYATVVLREFTKNGAAP